MGKRLANNNFPDHISAQMVRLYTSEIEKYLEKFSKRLIDAYASGLEVDAESLPVLAGKMEKYASNISTARLERLTSRVGASINQWNYQNLKRQFREISEANSIPVIDTKANIPTVSALLNRWSETNAGLIKQAIMQTGEIATGTALLQIQKDVAEISRGAVSKGESIRTVKKKIMEKTGVIASKAKFWARDQVTKGYQAVNQERSRDAGFPGYIWITSVDARVRPDHMRRHGQYFKWGESDLDPGDDYQCRCDASPAFGSGDAYSKSRIKKDIAFIKADKKFIEAREKVKRIEKKIRKAKQQQRKLLKQQSQLKIKQRTAPAKKRATKILHYEKQITGKPLEHAVAMDSKGNFLFDQPGFKAHVSFTENQWARMYNDNVILTHNHPGLPKSGIRNSQFSFADLSVAKRRNLLQVRAVGRDYVHVMERPPGGWRDVTEATMRAHYKKAEANAWIEASEQKIKRKLSNKKFNDLYGKLHMEKYSDTMKTIYRQEKIK